MYGATRDDLRQMPAEPALIEVLIAMQRRMQLHGYRQRRPKRMQLQIRLGVKGNNTAVRKLHLRLGCQVQAKEKVQEQLVWSAAPCR